LITQQKAAEAAVVQAIDVYPAKNPARGRRVSGRQTGTAAAPEKSGDDFLRTTQLYKNRKESS